MLYLLDMETTATTKDTMTTSTIGIKIAELLLEMTKLKGRDAFLPGVYDRMVSDGEALLAKRIANA